MEINLKEEIFQKENIILIVGLVTGIFINDWLMILSIPTWIAFMMFKVMDVKFVWK